MSTIQVKVVRLKISEHPNAERLQIAEINGAGGFTAIVAKNEFQDGDLAIFIPENSVVPQNIQDFLKANKKIEIKDGRIRCSKIRQVFSDGLCLVPSVWLPSKVIKEDYDATEYLGIKKYEPPPPSNRNFGLKSKGVNYHYENPNFKEYTDIENFKKHPRAFDDGEEVITTIKYHGSNWRASIVNRPTSSYTWIERIKLFFGLSVSEMEFLVGSHYRIKRKGKKAKVVEDKFLEMADKYDIEEILKALQISISKSEDEFFDDGFEELPEVAIYGELIGPGIQTNYEYGLTEHELRIFDVSVEGRFLDWDEVVRICSINNLPIVEQVYRGPWNLNITKLAEATDEYNGKKYTREGIVIKPSKERRSAKVGRVILKYISETFRLNKNNSEFH